MSAARTTTTLLLAVLLVGAADAWVHLAPEAGPERLPELAISDVEAVDRVVLARPDSQVELAREGEGWRLVAPVDAPADPQAVGALLGALSEGLRLEARVDAGHHDRYGLEGGEELRVELLDEGARVLAFYVGHNADAGRTWVRLPDADDVYLARIGGRSRFDRPLGAWRDRTVLDLDPTRVVGLEVRRDAGTITAARGEHGWSGPGVDPQVVEGFVAAVTQLRALEVLGREPDGGALATVVLELADGRRRTLTLGGAPDRVVARVDGRDEAWRVDPRLLEAVLDADAWRSRLLWQVPASEVLAFRLSGERAGRLERTDGGWRITDPPHVDADPLLAERVASFLAAPRVESWRDVAPSEAGFPSEHRWRVETPSGPRVLELGASHDADGARWVHVRDASAPERIGRVDARLVPGVERVFGF